MMTRNALTRTWMPATALALCLPLVNNCSSGGQSGDLSEDALSRTGAQEQTDGDAGTTDPTTPPSTTESPRWTQLSAPPLSGRVQATVASIGDSVVVVGGWSATCPPGADCVLPDVPPFADGAAYDMNAGQWSTIEDAPVGLRSATAAADAEALYVLSQCDEALTCPAGRTMLRYRLATDEWEQLPGLETGYFGLVASADQILAVSQSDESGPTPDYRWSPEDNTWIALPDDPLPPVYDRSMVAHEGHVYLFGSPIAREDGGTKLAARCDLETNAWEELTPSGTLGYQVWSAGGLFYLNPHFSNAAGGVYDPELDNWRAWPDDLPYHDLAGIIADDTARYEYPDGWVFDARDGAYLEIEPRPDERQAYDVVVARGGSWNLVVFGGQSWDSGEGELLNDTWLWSPPE